MKKYFILVLGLWPSLSWSSSTSQFQDFEISKIQVFKVLYENHSLADSPEKSFFKAMISLGGVSKEVNALFYQHVQALKVKLPLPQHFAKFQYLTKLTLKESSFFNKDSIPSVIKDLTNLKVLEIEELKKLETSTSYLTTLTNLEIFKAELCLQFNDQNTSYLTVLTALKTLHLNFLCDTGFTDVSLQAIRHLIGLEELVLGSFGENITTAGLDNIFQLTSLERLSLKWGACVVKEELNLSTLSHLGSLKSLSLTWITAGKTSPPLGLESIAQLTLLQGLRIYHGGLSKKDLPIILPSSLKKLTLLNLRGCDVFKDNSLEEFLKTHNFPKLKHVYWPCPEERLLISPCFPWDQFFCF